MYCKKCGNEVKEDAKFCPHCGGKININKINDENKKKVANKGSDKNWDKKVLKILIEISCIAIVVIGIIVIGYKQSNHNDKGNEVENNNQSFSAEAKIDEKISGETETIESLQTDEKTEVSTDGFEESKQIYESDLVGDWTIDSEKTNDYNPQSLRESFGTALSYGYALTFSDNGTFSWYVATGYGGEGTYTVNESDILCKYSDGGDNVLPDLEINQNEIIMTFDWGEGEYYKVYWMKNQKSVANVNVSEDSGEYILPESDSRYLTDSDVRDLTANELMLARNEIYARHGRKFKDLEIQAYFNSQSWYKGTVEPDDFSTDVFNKYEKENLEFIKKYEK